MSTTPWGQLVPRGDSDEFLIALNLDRFAFFEKLLPAFSQLRSQATFGSPYRRGPKVAGRPCNIDTVDILGLLLWYLESSVRSNSD